MRHAYIIINLYKIKVLSLSPDLHYFYIFYLVFINYIVLLLYIFYKVNFAFKFFVTYHGKAERS
jgi:hypothetical protein